MNFGISSLVEQQNEAMIAAWWESEGLHYLEVNISVDLLGLVTDNIAPIITAAKNQLDHWSKFHLSWFGRIAMIKVIILPKFGVFFSELNNETSTDPVM